MLVCSICLGWKNESLKVCPYLKRFDFNMFLQRLLLVDGLRQGPNFLLKGLFISVVRCLMCVCGGLLYVSHGEDLFDCTIQQVSSWLVLMERRFPKLFM